MCRSLTTALLAVALFAVSLSAAEPPWFDRLQVGMEVGPTGAQFGFCDPKDARYCERFDGREIVRQAAAAHSQYLVIWARDGDFAYYDSKLLPKAPGLGTRDPLREAVEEARKHRMPLIAYCVVQQGGHFLAAHPEWAMRDAAGQPIGRFCYNSGYLDAMKQIVAEQLTYGIDGFHIDMLDQGFGPPYGCWCDACRAQFEQEFQHPMPAGATWDAAWDDMLEFRYRTSERFEKALYAHVKATSPQATVDFNYHGNPPFSFEVGQRPVQHAGNADFVTGETGVWGFSALGVGLNAEFYRATTPGHRFQVAIQRGVRMYHDQTTRPLNDIRWELFTLLSHGALVTMVDKTGFDGGLDPVAYRRIGEAFAEVLDKQTHFGQRPVFDVGLYFSSRSRDWIGRDNPYRYFQAFLGAHRACVLEHLQFGVLLDENLSLAALQQFPVVCLPSVGILSDREIALFRQYVEEGGKLLVTGPAGLYDRMGGPQAESALSELIGAKVKERRENLDHWVRFSPADLAPDGLLPLAVPPDWPLLVEGPAAVYEPTSARPIGELLAPHRSIRQLEGKEGTPWPMSPDAPVGPALLVNHLGRGTVATIAASPDVATASEHPVVEARQLFRAAVRLLDPAPRVEIDAPASVEAVVTDDPAGRTLRVHFIAYNATPQTTPGQNRPYVLPGLIEDTPIFRATIRHREPAKTARAVGEKTSVKWEGATVEVLVEEIHEVVLVEY